MAATGMGARFPSETKPDLRGTSIGRFLIGERLGQGGMGEVYRAQDTALKRTVALKRITPQLRGEEHSRARLWKEAERASRLNDPHIAAVYDVLEDRNDLFVVMEYIEGQSLRERLKQPLAVREFLPIAVQCAEALAAAHQAGILHRDIKPANIMLTPSGQVKILDFGVARSLPGSAVTTTLESFSSDAFAGTLAYMAPEVLDKKEADGRADIFSLGAVFYEALAGRNPFQASGFLETCDRILRQDPPPLREDDRCVAPELERIIAKMLAKNPAERYATAADLAVDLRSLERSQTEFRRGTALEPRATWRRASKFGIALPVIALAAVLVAVPSVRIRVMRWFGVPAVPHEKQVAVLPFATADPAPESAAFAAGLTATLTAKLTALTQDRSLQVVPASDVISKQIRTAEQARKEFGANLVVEGSLHRGRSKDKDEVRVAYALVDARARRQLRADSITVAADDPFAVEDRVVDGVTGMLELEVPPRARQAFASHGTQVPSAYDYYVQGRGYLLNYDRPENVASAIAVFQQALRLDPNYALAYAGLGEAYWNQYRLTKSPDWINKSRQACEHALTLNGALAAGHICLGTIYNGTGAYEKAIPEFQRALDAEPTSDAAYRGLANAYERASRLDEAEKTYRRAIELRPHYWAGYNWLGVFYYNRARYRDAARMFQQVVLLAPDSFRGYSNLGAAFLEQGNYAEAIPLLEKSIAIRPTASAYSNLGTAHFFQHEFGEAARYYEEAVKLMPLDYGLWGNLAEAYYWDPGQRRQADAALNKAVSLGTEELRINANNPGVLADLALYFSMLGRREDAQASIQKAVRVSPGGAEVCYRAAKVASHLGEDAAALEWLQKALAAGISPVKVRNEPVFNKFHGHPGLEHILEGH